jgi:hypothetical protein
VLAAHTCEMTDTIVASSTPSADTALAMALTARSMVAFEMPRAFKVGLMVRSTSSNSCVRLKPGWGLGLDTLLGLGLEKLPGLGLRSGALSLPSSFLPGRGGSGGRGSCRAPETPWIAPFANPVSSCRTVVRPPDTGPVSSAVTPPRVSFRVAARGLTTPSRIWVGGRRAVRVLVTSLAMLFPSSARLRSSATSGAGLVSSLVMPAMVTLRDLPASAAAPRRPASCMM